MIISFTLNQTEAFALSESRFNEAYTFARKFFRFSTGEFAQPSCVPIMVNLHSQVRNWTEDDGNTMIVADYETLESFTFEKSMVLHAYEVHMLMLEVKLALNRLHLGEMAHKDVYRKVKDLKAALQHVEW